MIIKEAIPEEDQPASGVGIIQIAQPIALISTDITFGACIFYLITLSKAIVFQELQENRLYKEMFNAI